MSPEPIWELVSTERIVETAMQLVTTPSPTGDTREVAALYERMLTEAGCTVKRYEFVENNPTLVATFSAGLPGRTVLFSGHMDTIPLAHEPAAVRDGRIYGRGSNDMKGSLACIVEAIRVMKDHEVKLPGQVIVVASSLHESPGGRGEDLMALAELQTLQADIAVVMEGATVECTVAQFGSATFEITINRPGEPSHQLYTPPGTPHPIYVAAELIQLLKRLNVELEQEHVEDIGYASYFIGSLHSGQFYNQFPTTADFVGVRRYSPTTTFEEVEKEFRSYLDRLAHEQGVEIILKLEKVRDGYRIDKNHPAIDVLAQAVREVRGIPLPLVGKKVVTDAGIFVKNMNIPTLCHGPDQSTAHGDIEYVEISELELTSKVYLKFIKDFMK